MSKPENNDLFPSIESYLNDIYSLWEEGQFQKSYEGIQELLPILKRTEKWELYVEMRNKVGEFKSFSENIANIEATETYLATTLELALERLDNQHEQTIKAYERLGYWFSQIMGNPLKARPYFEAKLQSVIHKYGEISTQTIETYNSLGQGYALDHNPHKAVLYCEKAIDTVYKLKKTDKPQLDVAKQVELLINLGGYFVWVEPSKSLHYLNLALDTSNKHDFKTKTYVQSYIYNNITTYYLYKDEFSKALSYAEKTLNKLSEYAPSDEITEHALVYNKMGSIYALLGNYPKAIQFYQKSVQINRRFFKAPHSDISQSLYAIGHCFLKEKKYLSGLDYLQKSLQALIPSFQANSIYDYPKITHTINDVLFLQILRLKIQTLFQCYVIEEENNKIDYLITGLKGLNLSMDLMDSIRRSYQLTPSYLRFLSTPKILSLFSLGLKISTLANKPKNAFKFCEKGKNNLLLASMRESASKAAEIPSQLLKQEKTLKNKLTFWEKQIAQEEAKGENQREKVLLQWKSQFFDLHQEYLQLIQQFEQDYPDYYQLKYETKTISIEEIQENLSEDQVMVNYFVGEDRYYIFLITSNGFEVFEDEKPDDFEQTVERFLQAIQNHQLEVYTETALQLYQCLLQPFEYELMDVFAVMTASSSENEVLGAVNPKKLIVIPHGILSYLPFEALICSPVVDPFAATMGEADKRRMYQSLDYLLLHCEVSYHYSATLWHYLLTTKGEQAPSEHDFVGFAPVYELEEEGSERSEARSGGEDKKLQLAAKRMGQWATRSEALRSDGTWTPLPHSKVETERVAALFEGKGLKATTFLHEQATKERFREVVEGSRFLLIAAHGVVNDEQPKLSGLVFFPTVDGDGISNNEHRILNNEPLRTNNESPITNHQTDCILSMEETYHLNLKADLVVLSSCESGIGELAKGEGMMAVNRGFLYAGAKNVVSTLFKVYDKPSSLLTQYLFEGVLEGMSYMEALRAAKLRLLRVEEVDVKSWCGFVLIG